MIANEWKVVRLDVGESEAIARYFILLDKGQAELAQGLLDEMPVKVVLLQLSPFLLLLPISASVSHQLILAWIFFLTGLNGDPFLAYGTFHHDFPPFWESHFRATS